MSAAHFKIKTINGRAAICSRLPGIEIMIYDLNSEQFTHYDDQIVFYGTGTGRVLAFVSQFDIDTVEAITGALTWYAQHQFKQQLEITLQDPRINTAHLVN